MASVSVVIPTHDRASMLLEAVDSVLGQSHEPEEILVVDDGSTDLTQEVMAPILHRVRYMKTPHRGVSHARNTGYRSARGEWIAFLDSDDLWLPRKLELQLQALGASGDTPLCYTDEIWVRRGRRVNPCKHHAKHSGWIFHHCLPRCIISPSSALVRREVLEELGGFDESMPVCEDYDLWLRLTSKYPVLFLAEKLIIKRGGHPDQLSRQVWGMDRFRIRALDRLIRDPRLRQDHRTAAILELQRKCRIYSQGARKRGRSGEALWYEKLAQEAWVFSGECAARAEAGCPAHLASR
jgi:GT2 family glycosyltransferase